MKNDVCLNQEVVRWDTVETQWRRTILSESNRL